MTKDKHSPTEYFETHAKRVLPAFVSDSPPRSTLPPLRSEVTQTTNNIKEHVRNNIKTASKMSLSEFIDGLKTLQSKLGNITVIPNTIEYDNAFGIYLVLDTKGTTPYKE